jgi:hypothetical protein
MSQSSLLRTISRCSWRSSTRHSNGCSSSHSAGGNGNHGLRCFGDGTTLQRLRHMPRRPVGATRLPVAYGTFNRHEASEDGTSMTFIIEIASYDLQLLGDLLWKVLQPQAGPHDMLEPNDRTLSTVGACVEQGFGPRTVRAATMSPMYWGRPEGNLAQAYQTAFECQVEWNGKVSERYAHPRIWGSQVMRVTVDRTQATVPVRHC